MSQLLLIDDVDGLGRSGDIVKVKPGYARNFLLPQQKALIASKGTLRMQKQLQEKRRLQAIEDKLHSEKLALRLTQEEFSIEVKVDPEGHMYGSVGPIDIVRLLAEKGISVEKHDVVMKKHFKTLGVHLVNLKLREGVEASFALKVFSNSPVNVQLPVIEKPIVEEIQ